MNDLIEVRLLGDESYAELCVYKNDDLIAHYPVSLDDLTALAKSAPEILMARRGQRQLAFYNDPYATVFQAFREMYPSIKVELGWATPDELDGAKGCCQWSPDGDVRVALDVTLPVIGSVDILCHELAHVVACKDCNGDGDHHCQAWADTYARLRDRYCEIVEGLGHVNEVEIPGLTHHLEETL